MADTLIAGTTLVEKESRSAGDVPIGGVIQWAKDLSGGVNTFPDNFIEANGQAITDPLSQYNGSNAPNLNTRQWTNGGIGWIAVNPDTDTFRYGSTNGTIISDGASIEFVAQVNLPDGVIITEAEVFGNISDETWFLKRELVASSTDPSTLASANLNTADTSIINATVDNTLYKYFLFSSSLDTTDSIFGAKITYTSEKDSIWLIRIK